VKRRKTLLVDHQCRVFGSPWRGVYGTRIESARHYDKHWHATYGLGWLEHGAHSSASGRGSVDAYAGDLITTNPGEVHDGRPLGGCSRRWRMVYLDPAVIASIGGCPSSTDVSGVELVHPVIQDPILSRALQGLFACLEAWNDHQRRTGAESTALEESLVLTCGLLLNRHSTSRRIAEVTADVRKVRDRLADELASPPTLLDMAMMTGLSRYQILRRFEKAYGVPPHTWLSLHRGERARNLIRDGVSLSEAAAACGFADQSHLTRHFVRRFGFTPGAWQRAITAVDPAKAQ